MVRYGPYESWVQAEIPNSRSSGKPLGDYRRDYLQTKAMIDELNALQNYSDSAALFLSVHSEIDRRGDLEDYLRLSDPILERMPIEVIFNRRKALVYTNRPQQALNELELQLQVAHPLRTQHELFYWIAKTHHVLGNLEKATQWLDRLLHDSDVEQEKQIQASLEKAYFIYTQDPTQSFELLIMAKSKMESCSIPEPGDLYFNLGLYYEFVGELQKAINSYQQAKEMYEISNNSPKKFMAFYNVIAMDYNLGNLDQALSQLNHLRKECQKHSLFYVLAHCNLLQAAHHAAQGNEAATISLLEANKIDRNSPGKHSLSVKFTKQLANFYCETGKYSEAAKLLRKIFDDESLKQDTQEHQFLSSVYQKVIFMLGRGKNNESLTLSSDEILFLTGPYRSRLLFLSLWMNLRNYFEADLKSYLGNQILVSSENMLLLMKYRYAIGMHALYYGHLKRAAAELETSYNLSQRFGLHYWQFLNTTGLISVALALNQIQTAKNYCNQAMQLLPHVNDPNEIHKFYFLYAAVSWRLHDKQAFDIVVNKIPPDSIYFYGVNFLSYAKRRRTNSDSVQRIYEPKAHKYILNLMGRIGIPPISRVNIRTMKSEFSCYQYEIPQELMRASALVYDRIKQSLRVGKEKFKLGEKPLLEALLYYLLMKSGYHTKEEIITYVWHEKYNCLVHDTRIYSAIKRLKEWLEPFLKTDLISCISGSYGIHSHIKFAVIQAEQSENSLTERQTWILKFLSNNGSANRQAIQQALKLSPMTIKRELRNLLELNKIIKEGSGKAIYYRSQVDLF